MSTKRKPTPRAAARRTPQTEKQSLPAEVQPSSSRPGRDIAVVGLSCLFPKSGDVGRYWSNILRKVDCIEEVSPERWSTAAFFDADRFAKDKVYSKWGGFLEAVRFDPMRWKFPPSSLLSIDPIQLLALEVAAEAFTDAGWDQKAFPKERTGCIFACAGSHDVGSHYAFRTMLQHYLPRVKDLTAEVQQQITDGINGTLPEWTEDSFPGFLLNVVAGRIANRYDLGGPNYIVDAACAASLAALHAALAQLRLGTVDAMVVGGADGTNNPFCYMSFAKTHALSPRGRSRPFDNSADGIALGEGIAAIVLRRLEDAERDGDHIYAVIKGIGASSDGRNRSMTAPHPPGQILAMQRAYEDADVPAASVSLVEAHGTGTAVGDSTEITSLHTLFSQATSDTQYAAVGSVKSQIGHTKTCAGLASLVKTTLALHHRILPPTINVEKPNENVDFRQSPFFINTETRPWFEELGEHPRRAGVSAFGFGGTNFHVVMEEYTGSHAVERDDSPRPAELFVWQRGNKAEIVGAVTALQTGLAAPVTNLAQLAHSLRTEEAHGLQPVGVARLAIVATTVDDLRTKLAKTLEHLATKDAIQDPGGIYYSQGAPVEPSRVAFLYPGQGSQSVNMLRDVVALSRWAQPHFTRANRQLKDFFPVALTRLVYPPPVFTPEEDEERKQKLNDTAAAQPALGLVETFATDLLARFGLQPAAAAGHSYGEYVALWSAGVLSTEDLLHVSAERGRVSAYASQTTPGAMAAVQAGAAATRQALKELDIPAELANLNAPDQTIIAGPTELIVRAAAELTARGLKTRKIPVTAAFHTPALATAAEALGRVLQTIDLHAPTQPVYSNTLAAKYPTKPAEVRKLLARHITEPVRFEEQIRQMRADGYEVFIEVGPGRVLTGLVQRILADQPATLLSLDAPGRDGMVSLAHLLAQATALGLPVQLEPWFAGRCLKSTPVAEYLAEVQKTAKPKPTDWLLSVWKSEPVTPLPVRKHQAGEALRAKFGGKTATNGAVAATPTPVASVVPAAVIAQAAKADTIPQTVTASASGVAPLTATAVPVSRLQPAPAPAPLPPPASRLAAVTHGAATHAAATNGSTTNGHSPGPNGSVPHGAVRNGVASQQGAATNGVAAPVRVPTVPMASSAVGGVVVPGSAVPLAPCLPLVSDPNTFTLFSSPVMRSPVSTNLLPTESTASLNPAAAQMVLQSQALMMQLLDLQKWQQQVALRFVDAHQQLLQSSTGFANVGYLPSPQIALALPTPAVVAAPAPVVAPAPAAAPIANEVSPAVAAPVAAPKPATALVTAVPKPVAVAAAPRAAVSAPAPALKAVAPAPAVSVAPSTNGHGAHAVPAPKTALAPAPQPAALTPVAEPVAKTNGNASGVPTLEEFRADLMDAVSERTGYPIEMLDPALPLEAGLGIDSIKTVEIFSNLKKYHSFFQQDDQDEEEALKEFTKLKSLGDILSAYELRYLALTSGAAPSKSEGSQNLNTVERYSLEAVAAGSTNGEKKTTHARS